VEEHVPHCLARIGQMRQQLPRSQLTRSAGGVAVAIGASRRAGFGCRQPRDQENVGLVRVVGEGASVGGGQELGEDDRLGTEVLEERQPVEGPVQMAGA